MILFGSNLDTYLSSQFSTWTMLLGLAQTVLIHTGGGRGCRCNWNKGINCTPVIKSFKKTVGTTGTEVSREDKTSTGNV